MKKTLFAFFAMLMSVLLSSSAMNKPQSNEQDIQDNYIYYSKVNAVNRDSGTETIYIYYKKDISGKRNYYYARTYPNPSSYNYIYKNPLFRNSACNDYRRNYEYQGGSGEGNYFFSTTLPDMNLDYCGDYDFYSCVKAMSKNAESEFLYIYYKKDLSGKRTYYYSRNYPTSSSYNYVYKNPLFHNSDCDDSRRNYEYQGGSGDGNYFFSTTLPDMNLDYCGDYDFYSCVKALSKRAESEFLYIYYKKDLSGKRTYYYSRNYPTSSSYNYVYKNSRYHSSTCNDLRRDYKYQGGSGDGDYFFNATLPDMK